MERYQRRNFLKQAAILGAAFTFLPSGVLHASSRLRIGVIGSGEWGMQYLPLALKHPDLEVRALCDIRQSKLAPALQCFTALGKIPPTVYTDSKHAWQQMLQANTIDAVLIATPWQQHYTMALQALKAGKHVLCGPVMGTTAEQHYALVAASVSSGKQYITLDENDFSRPLMAMSNMVQQGVLGDVQEVRTGISVAQLPGLNRYALPYALQGSGVAAAMLGLGKDNPFVSVSLETDMVEYQEIKVTAKTKQQYLVHNRGKVPVIKAITANGQTLVLQQETDHRKPYALDFRVKAEKGHWLEAAGVISLADNQSWQGVKPHLEQYDHPVWTAANEQMQNPVALTLQHAVTLLKQGKAAPLAVYASAAMGMLRPMAAKALHMPEQKITMASFIV